MGAMKTKYQIKQKIMTPDGPGVVLEVEPGWAEYKIKLEGGKEVYVLEEDLTPQKLTKRTRTAQDGRSGDKAGDT
jgi:hypothetical protein